MIRDALALNSLLRTLHRFVVEECIPLEEEVDRRDALPESLVARMRELGLFGHSIPQPYGGAGLSSEELSCVNMVVSQAAPVFRARFGGNTGIASEALVVDGTDDQKARYLPLLASGQWTGCFALTEPEAGSDATAITTIARRGVHRRTPQFEHRSREESSSDETSRSCLRQVCRSWRPSPLTEHEGAKSEPCATRLTKTMHV